MRVFFAPRSPPFIIMQEGAPGTKEALEVMDRSKGDPLLERTGLDLAVALGEKRERMKESNRVKRWIRELTNNEQADNLSSGRSRSGPSDSVVPDPVRR